MTDDQERRLKDFIEGTDTGCAYILPRPGGDVCVTTDDGRFIRIDEDGVQQPANGARLMPGQEWILPDATIDDHGKLIWSPSAARCEVIVDHVDEEDQVWHHTPSEPRGVRSMTRDTFCQQLNATMHEQIKAFAPPEPGFNV